MYLYCIYKYVDIGTSILYIYNISTYNLYVFNICTHVHTYKDNTYI